MSIRGHSRPRLIIGLMSGTSVDGIDAALVRIASDKRAHYSADVIRHTENRWPKDIRARLLAIMAPAITTTEEICQLNAIVAEAFAGAAFTVAGTKNLRRKGIAAIGSHGQTVCHLPPGSIAKGVYPSTLQLGDPSIIATLTGVPVVGNFRPADMALGGQSAPLVPWTDMMLLSDAKKTRCIQNIGGIANVTYLPSGQGSMASGQKVIAFDTGPGNMLLDAAIAIASNGRQTYDKGGCLAARGNIDVPLFRRLQAHPYFTRKPPKSTGREDFGLPFAKQLLSQYKIENGNGRKSKIENLLHTLTRLTAWSIADAYLHFLPEIPDEVILCGGGADNPTLVRMLSEELSTLRSPFTHPNPPKLLRIDDFGIPNKAKEAASFALLAAATLDGIPANLPSVTGAARPTLLGIIAPAL